MIMNRSLRTRLFILLRIAMVCLCGLWSAASLPSTTFTLAHPHFGSDKQLLMQTTPQLFASTLDFTKFGQLGPSRAAELILNSFIEVRRGEDQYGAYDEYHLIQTDSDHINRYYIGRCEPTNLRTLETLGTNTATHNCWHTDSISSEKISNPIAHVTYQLAYARSSCRNNDQLLTAYVDLNIMFKLDYPEPITTKAYSSLTGTLATIHEHTFCSP